MEIQKRVICEGQPFEAAILLNEDRKHIMLDDLVSYRQKRFNAHTILCNLLLKYKNFRFFEQPTLIPLYQSPQRLEHDYRGSMWGSPTIVHGLRNGETLRGEKWKYRCCLRCKQISNLHIILSVALNR